jgi:hypothetical protein
MKLTGKEKFVYGTAIFLTVCAAVLLVWMVFR